MNFDVVVVEEHKSIGEPVRGGLYTGLRGAQICSRVACKALSRDCLYEKSLAEYQYLQDGDLHKPFRSLDHPYWRRLIARHGDIDYSSPPLIYTNAEKK